MIFWHRNGTAQGNAKPGDRYGRKLLTTIRDLNMTSITTHIEGHSLGMPEPSGKELYPGPAGLTKPLTVKSFLSHTVEVIHGIYKDRYGL